MTAAPDETAVVVGAGLAGLAAAVTLARAGVEVRLLESEPRVGGRVLTVRSPLDDGLYAEAGGEFVDGGHLVLHDFLLRYGLELLPIPSGQRLFRFDGTILRGESLSDLGAEAARDEARFEREAAKLAARVGDTGRPWASAADLDRQSVGSWLDDLKLGRVARAYHQIWRTVDYGVAPERLSLLQYARDERLWQKAPDLISGRVQGGMDRLPLAMAAELGERVLLSAAVTSVRQDEHGVSVTYQQGGGAACQTNRVAERQRAGTTCSLRARYGVLAIPPAALRRIALEPALPESPRAAVDGMAMSRVTKLLVQVRRRFWEHQGIGGRALTDGMVQATYETTAGQPGERAVLTVYTADQTADALAAMSDAERQAICLAELERLYPGCSADVEQIVTAAWSVGGPGGAAYSHFLPGDVTRFGPWLAEPVGRLHLAGEHTDQWQATMNGALSSGLRAAREILARL